MRLNIQSYSEAHPNQILGLKGDAHVSKGWWERGTQSWANMTLWSLLRARGNAADGLQAEQGVRAAAHLPETFFSV